WASRPSAPVPSLSAAEHRDLHSFPTRRSSDLSLTSLLSRPASWSIDLREAMYSSGERFFSSAYSVSPMMAVRGFLISCDALSIRSEEHTSELQSRENLVCRLLLEKKKGEPCRS